MRAPKLFKHSSDLEIAAYSHAVRRALRLTGAFVGFRGTIGLILPPDADTTAYKEAVNAVLEEAQLSKIFGVAEAYVLRRGDVDFEEILSFLRRLSSVIALITHGAVIPPEVELALDKVEPVEPMKAEHAAIAVKSVLDLSVTSEQAERLVRHPAKVWLRAMRPGRKVDEVIARLEAATAQRKNEPWEPRVEELAGYGEAAAWAQDLATDFPEWRAGRISWRDVDRGLLISGPPGTGKTIFAAAVARTCGVGFVSASSAEWQSKGHLGDMLAAMRKSFRDAAAAAPSILFIDELDAIGDRRAFSGRNATYENQVVNALLELLDGTAHREGVVVIAATNYPDKIDPALRRPGRLDRHVKIPLPDRKARAQILQVHFREPLTDDELRTAAIATGGSSGADLEQLARTARRNARREGRAPAFPDIMALLPGDVTVGDDERRTYCYHEAGHAVVGLELGFGAVDVIVVALQAGVSESSLGHVSWKRVKKRSRSRQSYLDEIAMIMGGMAAERVFYKDQYDSCGGSWGSDLHRASDIATYMLTSLGMGVLCYFGAETQADLEKLRRKDPTIRARVDQILSEQLERAERIVREKQAEIERLVTALSDRDILPGGEVVALVTPCDAGRRRLRKPDR